MFNLKQWIGTVAIGAALLAPGAALATPPNPSPGVAVVDGAYAEWNLVADFFTNMYRAGNPSKPLESKCYLRYNCITQTVYVLVLSEPNIITYIDPSAQTSWVAINAQNNKVVTENSGNDGIPPDFAWVQRGFDGDNTHAKGYEASFNLAPGSYQIIVHAEVLDGGSMTSASPGFPSSGPPLVLQCNPLATEPSTWSRIKALER